MSDENRRGGFGSPGSRVFANENIQSEFVLPIISGLALIVLACLAVGIVVFDSLILGWSSWGIAGLLIIGGIGAYITNRAYQQTGDWYWITGAITVSVLACAAWCWWGFDWIRSIWPHTRFVRRISSWSTFNKIFLQPIVAALLYAFYAVYVRLRIEIADPGWSRRFEREAQFVGAKPNWPMSGSRFPSQKLEERIEDLEVALEESKIERRRVDVSVTNEDDKTVEFAELPDDDNARRFYQRVSNGASFSTQTAIACKCRAEFENEIRPTFLDRKWAYWKNPKKPKAGIKLRAAGWKTICNVASPYSETV